MKLSDVKKGKNLMLMKLTPVATLLAHNESLSHQGGYSGYVD